MQLSALGNRGWKASSFSRNSQAKLRSPRIRNGATKMGSFETWARRRFDARTQVSTAPFAEKHAQGTASSTAAVSTSIIEVG